ncbi:MBL fold metallo-hydrolase [Paenibacillus chartarius]|uniref:MBL fold metallo-hydrolase n=1 Tax=Paenibacillus chartarius TaxID=747481 RepID=A0ABV6DJA7_9BACL
MSASSKTSVRFWSGLRTIGGTVVTVQYEDAKIVFDFGAAYNPAANVLDGQVRLRQGALLHDYIRLGTLPGVDGLYEAEQLRGLSGIRPFDRERDARTAVFISHLHYDHMLGIGLIPEHIPVYMSRMSRRLYRRLHKIGEGVAGSRHRFQAMPGGLQPVRIGAIEVTALPVDHDILGACAFHIRTPDGTILYTGDLRFHGNHPEWTEAMMAKAKELGADILIIEGTMLNLPNDDGLPVDVKPADLAPSRELPEGWTREPDMPGLVANRLLAANGLALVNTAPRNVERLVSMAEAARQAGRMAVFEPESAYLLHTMTACRDFLVYESDTTSRLLAAGKAPGWLRKTAIRSVLINAAGVNRSPSRYLLQNTYGNLLELLDLDTSGGIYVHSDGVPLGSFDPTYGKLLAFLESLGLPFAAVRCSGHAPAENLKYIADMIDPPTLVPLHSFHPELLLPKSGVQLLPEYGRTYRLEGGRLL